MSAKGDLAKGQFLELVVANRFIDRFDQRHLIIVYQLQYKCKEADLIQFFPKLPTSHDCYTNFFCQAKELSTTSAKVGGVTPHTSACPDYSISYHNEVYYNLKRYQ